MDDELEKNAILRFNQRLGIYLQVSVGNDTYNLTKYDKIHITDTTTLVFPNTGAKLLQNWKIIRNDKNNNCNKNTFVRSTKTTSPTGYSGATSLPPIGNGFVYIETSSYSHRNIVCVSFGRTDIIQISNLTFYYNRCSIITNDSLKSMGRFRIQLSLENITWSTWYNIPKIDRHSDSSTDHTLVSLNFSEDNYGFKLIYDEIGTVHAYMCFSYITITHSVFENNCTNTYILNG